MARHDAVNRVRRVSVYAPCVSRRLSRSAFFRRALPPASAPLPCFLLSLSFPLYIYLSISLHLFPTFHPSSRSLSSLHDTAAMYGVSQSNPRIPGPLIRSLGRKITDFDVSDFTNEKGRENTRVDPSVDREIVIGTGLAEKNSPLARSKRKARESGALNRRH